MSNVSKLDIEAVATEIYQVLCDVYPVSPWTLRQVKDDLLKENTEYFFSYDGAKIVGFMALEQMAGELELTNIAIKSDYQGQGRASRLMAQLNDREEAIFLEVRASNTTAYRLYQQNDFEEVARRKSYYHNPVEDALVMQRREK